MIVRLGGKRSRALSGPLLIACPRLLDQHGYLVGAPSYILAGELAVGRPLRGQLPHAEFSDALATSASRYWAGRARVSLMFATIYADIGERVACQGMLASAILSASRSA